MDNQLLVHLPVWSPFKKLRKCLSYSNIMITTSTLNINWWQLQQHNYHLWVGMLFHMGAFNYHINLFWSFVPPPHFHAIFSKSFIQKLIPKAFLTPAPPPLGWVISNMGYYSTSNKTPAKSFLFLLEFSRIWVFVYWMFSKMIFLKVTYCRFSGLVLPPVHKSGTKP